MCCFVDTSQFNPIKLLGNIVYRYVNGYCKEIFKPVLNGNIQGSDT